MKTEDIGELAAWLGISTEDRRKQIGVLCESAICLHWGIFAEAFQVCAVCTAHVPYIKLWLCWVIWKHLGKLITDYQLLDKTETGLVL